MSEANYASVISFSSRPQPQVAVAAEAAHRSWPSVPQAVVAAGAARRWLLWASSCRHDAPPRRPQAPTHPTQPTTLLLQLPQGTWAYSPPSKTSTEVLYTYLFHFGTKVPISNYGLNAPASIAAKGCPSRPPVAFEFSSLRMKSDASVDNSTKVLRS